MNIWMLVNALGCALNLGLALAAHEWHGALGWVLAALLCAVVGVSIQETENE